MAKITDPATNINGVSRISTGTVIRGEITSPADIRIDGTFIGKVHSEGRVVVGEEAQIEGQIICNNIDMWGKTTGDIYVKDTLTLHEGCSVTGDLHIRRLVVELGAHFDGNCKMIEEAEFDSIVNQQKATAQNKAEEAKVEAYAAKAAQNGSGKSAQAN